MRSVPYRDPTPSPALMRLLGPVNRHLILPRLLRVARLDLPAPDVARLRAAVNPDTAAFMAPGHPEFMTDWMIDKELSCQCAPLVASWAAEKIVNASPLAQRFWLANGLIANTPGGGGKAYSIRNARQGRGVLLHPEGAVNWQAERIAPLRPGAIDMAMQAARTLADEHDSRPVFVVPMVWRLTFTADVSRKLVGEMQRIESARGLTVWPSPHPAERLASLLAALLMQRAHQLGLSRPDITRAPSDGRYFDAQERMHSEIHAYLGDAYGPLGDDPVQALRTIQRGIRRRANTAPERARRDRHLLTELHRLSHLDPAIYGRDTLTQEQIAEILKATRAALVTTGFFNRLHNFMPRAVASRVAHIRVAEPMDIGAAVTAGASLSSLVGNLHRRLQQAQDALGAELEPAVRRFRLKNPFVMAAEREWATVGA